MSSRKTKDLSEKTYLTLVKLYGGNLCGAKRFSQLKPSKR